PRGRDSPTRGTRTNPAAARATAWTDPAGSAPAGWPASATSADTSPGAVNPERFAFLRRSLSVQLVVALTRMFNVLGSWHRPDAQRFAAQAVPMVAGAQTALATLTSNYVASVASEALRRPVAPPPIPQAARARLRLVDPNEVYQRPFVAAYTALKDGQQLDQALGSARLRLREVAEGDMQLAYAHASRAALQGLALGQEPSGWRRVLVGPKNCAMCVVASTQRYHIKDLNPIHPSCDCQVIPIFGPVDRVIEPELLEQVHAAVKDLTGVVDRGARAVDYRHIMTEIVHHHGELGAMLARPGDRFTGPRGIPA
ncbi:MAG: hypothetical protein ACRDQZ_24045, partial [Mycobacteriales bacterium]